MCVSKHQNNNTKTTYQVSIHINIKVRFFFSSIIKQSVEKRLCNYFCVLSFFPLQKQPRKICCKYNALSYNIKDCFFREAFMSSFPNTGLGFGIWEPLPQMDALPILGPWPEFELMCLRIPQLPKHIQPHFTTVVHQDRQ